MTDTEKVKLINRIIVEFWEFNEEEDMRNGAVALVTAINTIVEFEEDKEDKHEKS